MAESGNLIVFNEMSSEQRRQLVDARQVFEAHENARSTQKHSYSGSMRWVTRKGHDYLHWKRGKSERSLGRRSPETEAKHAAFVTGRAEHEERIAGLSKRLEEMAPVNRALMLGRVPTLAARIIRRLGEESLLGSHLLIVGTNALFAYESRAGVLLSGELLATGDADLLWDARQGLALVSSGVRREGIIGLLQKVDRTFQLRHAGDFRAVNSDGYFVDLIRPEDAEVTRPGGRKTVGERDDDLRASPIFGLHWLINAPHFDAIAIGADGYPVSLASPDPRAFALHKLWVSESPRRDPVKRPRDRAQAQTVAQLCQRYFGLDFDSDDLRSLPKRLRGLARALTADRSD